MKRIILSTVVLLSLLAGPCRAQTLQQAEQAMKEFVRLHNAGGSSDEGYKMLRQCYAGFVAVVAAQTATAEYDKARESLKTIYPYLPNAAAFYSQRRDQPSAVFFARAYIDMPQMDAFRGEQLPRAEGYPSLAYFAASNAYNTGDYEGAVKYYGEYLATGETTRRQNALHFMTIACQKSGNNAMAYSVLDAALAASPNDFNILSMAINAALEGKDYQRLAGYVDKALTLRPNSQELLDIQGKMYEDTGDFERALEVFQKKRQLTPNSLSVAEHIAQNYYNLGAVYYNKSLLESNGQAAKRLRQSSDAYFRSAVKSLQEVLAANPASLKLTQALATAYSCLGDTRQLEATNFKLRTLGGQQVEKDARPAILATGQHTLPQPSGREQAAVAPTGGSTGMQQDSRPAAGDSGIPRFSAYARRFVQERLEQWQQKDAYETVDEYRRRVSDESQQRKLKELQQQAEREYIAEYSHTPRFDELRLMPYDAENQAFLIASDYGNMILPVPRERDEARIFESGWNGMQFKNPRFFVDGDSLALASLTFVTPTGNTYQFDNKQALEYLDTQVSMELAQVDYDHLDLKTEGTTAGRSQIRQKTVAIGTSDVDKNIPQAKSVNDRTFAVIIANENYRDVPPVVMAANDGATFAKYCRQTLGLPETNVRMYTDATLGSMMNAVKDITAISQAYDGDVSVIFYYAGHGIPDEATRDAYLLPVDADGRQVSVCYPLRTLYSELSEMGARRVVVFLDACFSGSTPDGGHLLASARGVAMKPKVAAPQGNMVVFSAASDAETAFPYEEKGHGLFTYYLLKKLQESKGNATLGELGDYVVKNVREKSVVVNRKSQTPTIVPSPAVKGLWESMKLK